MVVGSGCDWCLGGDVMDLWGLRVANLRRLVMDLDHGIWSMEDENSYRVL